MFKIDYKLKHFFISHMVCIILFTVLYIVLFNEPDKHYIFDSSIPKKEFIKHKWINSLYLSITLQTSTGYVPFNVRSMIGKSITLIQMLLGAFITIGFIYINVGKF